jgi:hypothetical protein
LKTKSHKLSVGSITAQGGVGEISVDSVISKKINSQEEDMLLQLLMIQA